MQAILVTFICLIFLFMPSVNGSYWLLSALSTQLYVLMYVLMLTAAMRLEKKIPRNTANLFTLPGGARGTFITCALGLCGCLITLIVGFIPPAGINVGGTLHYEQIFCMGITVMIVPVVLFFVFRHRQQKNQRLTG